ncbi:helix-turn-helix domain-containing protein [Olsenella profusa]|uniref:DNA-binding helix-turn-helix domain protein n=1 Tax=Olsenella profusa F0195 TaxID=1125712 RepID=U2TRQ2_9ACTN|nr:helix-turn-helix transcriptional regulator [Olsenella profusa]ERL08753.1 DNA-binding helix-turn-helix domain protein [Olsenella profusa F0195]
MDAHRFGNFVARRRKQQGTTQALLADRICVTDKAVSR